MDVSRVYEMEPTLRGTNSGRGHSYEKVEPGSAHVRQKKNDLGDTCRYGMATAAKHQLQHPICERKLHRSSLT